MKLSAKLLAIPLCGSFDRCAMASHFQWTRNWLRWVHNLFFESFCEGNSRSVKVLIVIPKIFEQIMADYFMAHLDILWSTCIYIQKLVWLPACNINSLLEKGMHRTKARMWRNGRMMTSPKWKHFLRYWPFVRGIHRWPVDSSHKAQWRGGCVFSLICAWTNGWASNRNAGDLRRHRAHYDVTVKQFQRQILQDSRFKHRLFRRNTNIHVYITIMDTWQNMFLNDNMIWSGDYH